jgi:hypothetical protein
MSNNEIVTRPLGTLRLYGAGGAGVNMTRHFHTAVGEIHPGMAQVHTAFIDTSRSNIPDALGDRDVFILTDSTGVLKDGGGKERSLNHPDIAANIKGLLAKFPPMDMNVVVFSASGGSGSVFGPLLMAEMIRQGLSVVGLVVGSVESVKTVNNTVNTLASLENLATSRELPIVIMYCENNEDSPRAAVDKIFRHAIGSLAVLASRRNAEMDSTDIRHMLHFPKSTSIKARLATLDIARSNEEMEVKVAEEGAQYIAMSSLYENPDVPTIAVRPEYHSAGYLTDKLEGVPMYHFGVRIDESARIASGLQRTLADMQKALAARVIPKTILTGNEQATDDGLIL